MPHHEDNKHELTGSHEFKSRGGKVAAAAVVRVLPVVHMYREGPKEGVSSWLQVSTGANLCLSDGGTLFGPIYGHLGHQAS